MVDQPMVTEIYATQSKRLSKNNHPKSKKTKTIEDDDDQQYFEFEHVCPFHPLQSYYLKQCQPIIFMVINFN